MHPTWLNVVVRFGSPIVSLTSEWMKQQSTLARRKRKPSMHAQSTLENAVSLISTRTITVGEMLERIRSRNRRRNDR